MGPLVAAVLTGTFVIESMYAIPGMGKFYVESVQDLDYTMVLGMTACGSSKEPDDSGDGGDLSLIHIFCCRMCSNTF